MLLFPLLVSCDLTPFHMRYGLCTCVCVCVGGSACVWQRLLLTYPKVGLILSEKHFLLTIILKTAYLTQSSLSASKSQSGHFPLTSLINQTLQPSVCFSFLFLPFFTSLSKLLLWKIPGEALSQRNTQLTPSGFNNHATLKVIEVRFFSFLFFFFLHSDVKWSFWPVSAWINALHSCHMIGWLHE